MATVDEANQEMRAWHSSQVAKDAIPKILFQVQVPLNGAELWTLCTCDTPEAAAEVVRCLLKVPSAGPQRVNVEKIYA